MARLIASDPGPLLCGPLALAVNAYWCASVRAGLSLDAGFAKTATEQVEALIDIADVGHPAVRGIAGRRATALIHLIDARYPEALA